MRFVDLFFCLRIRLTISSHQRGGRKMNFPLVHLWNTTQLLANLLTKPSVFYHFPNVSFNPVSIKLLLLLLLLLLFSIKNFISCLKAARALHFSSASLPLLGLPVIFEWLTAFLYLAFNSFARSFHPGTLNFEGFCIPIIFLPLLSIAFDINVIKSVSLLVSIPLLTHSSPPGAASSIQSNLW